MAASEALSEHIVNNNPLHREAIYRKLRGLCKHIGEVGIGPIDIALWDLAGKKYNSPIFEQSSDNLFKIDNLLSQEYY